ncbi:hypothetical protein JXA32_15020 [Candidatus Sumerlaeota bacterium]|nr:hypothetical protein [Candidatus Sumerlaeota bacterium]
MARRRTKSNAQPSPAQHQSSSPTPQNLPGHSGALDDYLEFIRRYDKWVLITLFALLNVIILLITVPKYQMNTEKYKIRQYTRQNNNAGLAVIYEKRWLRNPATRYYMHLLNAVKYAYLAGSQDKILTLLDDKTIDRLAGNKDALKIVHAYLAMVYYEKGEIEEFEKHVNLTLNYANTTSALNSCPDEFKRDLGEYLITRGREVEGGEWFEVGLGENEMTAEEKHELDEAQKRVLGKLALNLENGSAEDSQAFQRMMDYMLNKE